MKKIEILKLKPKGISFKKIKQKKRLIAIISILIIFAIIGNIFLKPKDTIVTDYTDLLREDIVKNINTIGTVESNAKVNVYSTLNNVAKEVNVEVGDRVNEGDILCVLDSTDLEREIDELSKNLELDKEKNKVDMEGKKQAYDNAAYIYNNNIDTSVSDCEKALKDAEIKLEDSQKDYDNKKVLFENGAIAQSDLDNAQSQLNQAKLEYDNCNINLESAKIKSKQELDNAKNAYDSSVIEYNNNKDEVTIESKRNDVEKCVIKAPASGTITAVNISVGNSAQGILFTIEDLDDPIITVDVKEIDVNKIIPGQIVEVSTDAAPDDEYALGTVLSISDTVKNSDNNLSSSSNSNNNSTSTTSNSNVFEAKIKLDNPNENDYIKVGMNAKANIILDKSENAFSASFSSILEEDTGKYVMIAKESEDGKYKVCKTPVETGLETDVSVEIYNEELAEGDKLLMDPTLYEDGQIISLMPNNGGMGYE